MDRRRFHNEKEYVIDQVISDRPDAHLKVYSAKDSQIGRNVILKEISYQSDTHKKQILMEITTQALLEKYTDCTPKIYNTFIDAKNNTIVIEMQKIEQGKTLRNILLANDPKPRDEKWYSDNYTLFLEICRAVAQTHDAPHFVHKDLKPENIMIKRKKVYIIDFGISGPGASKGIGTPAYMAPEQHSGVTEYFVGKSTDVFALGQIGIEMFSGAPLVYGEDIIYDPCGHVWLKEKDLSGIGSKAYPRLADVLKKAISMDPDDRYANAWKLVEALRAGRGVKNGK